MVVMEAMAEGIMASATTLPASMADGIILPAFPMPKVFAPNLTFNFLPPDGTAGQLRHSFMVRCLVL